MSSLIKCVVIGLIALFSVGINAHRDTVFTFDEKGLIKGLPNKYMPAYFDLKEKKLRIGKNAIQFPDCISKHFPKDEMYKIKSHGSWYHHKYTGGLPDYIMIRVFSDSEDLGLTYLVSMFLSLEDLKPIKTGYGIHIESGYGVSVKPVNSKERYLDIGLADNCIEKIELSIKDVQLKK